MIPIEFEEQNVIFAKDQKEYQPLPAHKNEAGEVVTCWELSVEEIQEISETGRLYIKVNTFNNPLQPIFCSTLKEHLLTE